jgi:hypothetical protein
MPNSGNGPGPLRPVGNRGAGSLTPSEAAGAAGASAPAEAAGAAQEATAAAPVAGSPPTEAIASALASGAIDPETARAQLIDQAVRSQLPHDASPATVAAIRAEVEALLRNDPLLEQLLRP